MLTRLQVARRLGRSVSTVRKMEGRVLHPTIGARGVRLFDVDEVEEVAEQIRVTGRALERAPRGAAFSSDNRARRRCSDSGHHPQLAKQAAWRKRVEDAVGALLERLPPLDEDACDAAEHLVGLLAEH